LQTLKTAEIWRSGNTEFEGFVALMDYTGTRFLTRKESPLDPPNLYLRGSCPPNVKCELPAPQKITNFSDPVPQLRGIKKQLVKYKRADGVDLSFTLYTPPNYKEGTRLPTLVWAYPLEFTDASVAGQVSGSTNRFTSIGGISHLFFLLNGYAVLDNATMPVVGDPETVNDTFIKQIVDSAKAAIDKAVKMGVTDPERVGVGGHSYGAFMTANLLAHSDLFRAGIARSGAYNRTLTPFGFQGERRNFWEATELYTKISPFFYANKINEPLLLIHGEADNNTGTFPIQSERLFAAVVGDPETVNDTFIKQINDSAKAAIDKAVKMGVTDPERVGVGGHSYGAFMTANLLAHSDLFRAGIARSGAYNRTLTPFGFQGERRNFWEATELYTKISPFFYANKINEPLLLIHGEADNNTGTFPIQSERLFAALQGTGGTARLVMLPYESHGYAGRESVEHTLYEMISWFDKYVKNAKPREKNQTAKQ
jgi:dipeptidyl aminopeptidase/acylaminoacyl peptidase